MTNWYRKCYQLLGMHVLVINLAIAPQIAIFHEADVEKVTTFLRLIDLHSQTHFNSKFCSPDTDWQTLHVGNGRSLLPDFVFSDSGGSNSFALISWK